MEFIDSAFHQAILEFVSCNWSIFLYQAMLMVWIVTHSLGDGIKGTNWRTDLGKCFGTVTRAISSASPFFFAFLAATALTKYFDTMTGVPAFTGPVFLSAMIAEILFLRLEWQVVKEIWQQEYGSELSIVDSFERVWIKYLAVSVLNILLISGTSVLLVIPGVIAALYLKLSEVICCLKGKGVIGSIKESCSLVEKNFVEVSNYLLPASLVISLVPVLITVYYSYNCYNLPDYLPSHPPIYWAPSFLLGCLSAFVWALWKLLSLHFLGRAYIMLEQSAKK